MLRKKGIEVERSKSGKRNITITKVAKTTDLIVPTVQEHKRIRKSSVRIATGKEHHMADSYVSHRSDPPVPRRADDQGDAVDQKQDSPESNASAEPKAMEAGREQGVL